MGYYIKLIFKLLIISPPNEIRSYIQLTLFEDLFFIHYIIVEQLNHIQHI